MKIKMAGGGTQEMRRRSVPEKISYPDALRFRRDRLPAYGFYIRHVRNVFFNNIDITSMTEDQREMFVPCGDIDSVFINGKMLE